MRILDRYILTHIIRASFLTMLIFCFLYIMIDITSNLEELIDRKVPLGTLLGYYRSLLPIILSQTSSMACLIGILMTFSSLNSSNEIIVMRSSGLSFWQITQPALMFGLLISVAIFCLNETLVPQATEVTQKLRNERLLRKDKNEWKAQTKIHNLTFYGLNNRLYYIGTYDHKTLELSGINIVEYDNNQNIQQKIVALKGHWTGIAWKFFQCQITTYSEEGVTFPVKVKIHREKLMDIKETPEDFLKQRLSVESMNIKDLSSYISKFSESGAVRALNNLRVDFHQKIAYPFGSFVIILVGLPFAMMIKGRRRSTFASVGIALGIGFLYYVLNAVCLALGKGGLFPPLLAAWASPLLFSGIAFLLIESNF